MTWERVPERCLLTFCALGVPAIVAPAAEAAVLTFTDQTSWQAAAPSFHLETFDGDEFEGASEPAGVPVTKLTALDLAVSLVDGTGDPTGMPSVFAGGPGGNAGGFFHSLPNVLTNNSSPATPNPGTGITFSPLTPGESIWAFGYWNTGSDDTTILEAYDANGSLLLSQSVSGGDPSFLGFVLTGDVGAATVVIRPTGVSGEGNGFFTIDDLQVVVGPEGTALVPSPPALALGAAVLVPLASRRRRS